MASEMFAAAWLALREPVDHRSRAAALLARLDGWWREHGASSVLDLGSGTGSNLRYLAPRLSGEQKWTLVDKNAGLLGRSPAGPNLDRVTAVQRVQGDLAREGLAAVANAELVTASALLDLVSQPWLDRLVDACAERGAAALFALTWDGSASFLADGQEDDPDDAFVLDLVRAHQLRNKGLGPALGPRAGGQAERAFQAAGMHTWLGASPWRLGADDRELVGELIGGWRRAASEEHPGEVARIGRWAERRRLAAHSWTFELVVGHQDLLVLPPEGS